VGTAGVALESGCQISHLTDVVRVQLHRTKNDTLNKIDPKALDAQVAVYTDFAWLSAETKLDFGKAPLCEASR